MVSISYVRIFKKLLCTLSELLDDPLSFKRNGEKNDIRRFAKPCNQHPTLSAQRGYLVDKNRFRIPRPSLDTRSHSSAADSEPAEVAVVVRSSPDSLAAEGARRTAGKMSCPYPASNRLDCGDSTYRPACASESPILESGTSDRDSASRGSRTLARESPFSPASSAGTWSPRSYCARVAVVVAPRPPVSAANDKNFFRSWRLLFSFFTRENFLDIFIFLSLENFLFRFFRFGILDIFKF